MNTPKPIHKTNNGLDALDEFAAELGLELMAAGDIPRASFVNVPCIRFDRLHQYHWPAGTNGTKHDRFVYAGIYSDGSWSIMLASEVLSFTGKRDELLAMARSGKASP